MKNVLKMSLIPALLMGLALPTHAKTAPKKHTADTEVVSKSAKKHGKNADKEEKTAKGKGKHNEKEVAEKSDKHHKTVAKHGKNVDKEEKTAKGKGKHSEKEVAEKFDKHHKIVAKHGKGSDKVAKVDKKHEKNERLTKTVAKAHQRPTVKLAVSEHNPPAKRQVIKTSYHLPTVVSNVEADEPKKPVVSSSTASRYSGGGSVGRQYGLHQTHDPVGLRASVALVVDQNSWTTLYQKNASMSLPIASITKLMTAMVTLDANLSMNEQITISSEDAAHYPHSRLTTGTTLSRHDVMLLALMSSENRAAYALGRTYPGGLYAFTQAMNAKAKMLGMTSAQFVDPSGLSPENRASAMDLAKMVNAATQYRTIRELSTNSEAYIYTAGGGYKKYVNSDRLISRNMGWDIGLQKTGTLSAAGKCLVLQTRINGTPKIMVFLDSSSANSRVNDAVKLKNWIQSGGTMASAGNYSNGMYDSYTPPSPSHTVSTVSGSVNNEGGWVPQSNTADTATNSDSGGWVVPHS